MMLFDAHLDLGLCGVDWNRDLRQGVDDIRAQETSLGMTGLGRCKNTLSLPELRAAGVGVCLTTLLSRLEMPINDAFGHSTPHACYAYAHAHLAFYRALESEGWLKQLRTAKQLNDHVDAFNADPQGTPLGYILTMEGADPLLTPATIDEFHAAGLRSIGLTHYGGNRYGGGTRADVGLSLEAVELIERIEKLGMTIDMTHLSDKSFDQVADRFGGRVHASHQNSRRLADWQRQFSDRQYQTVIDRDGVIGIAFDAVMMQHGYVIQQSEATTTIDTAAENIDIVCQLAGDCRHVGIGTDLDGGFGFDQTPTDLNRYTDLPPALTQSLTKRGYSDVDIRAIFHGNWLRFFSEVLDG